SGSVPTTQISSRSARTTGASLNQPLGIRPANHPLISSRAAIVATSAVQMITKPATHQSQCLCRFRRIERLADYARVLATRADRSAQPRVERVAEAVADEV